jgi:tetratricopeptide (TPR) repeat protein
LGQWDEAAKDYAALMELDPDDHWHWFHGAPLCLQTDKVEEYRRICREMLTRFGNTDKPEIAERTAKTCLLTPDAVSDLEPVLKLADKAVVTTPKEHPLYRWRVLSKGLAEYRAGHYADAMEWVNRFSPRADGVHWDATAFAVQAMAKHQLGLAPGKDGRRGDLANEAKQALQHAEAILSNKMPDPKEGRPWGKGWPYSVDNFHDWLHARILTNEAKALLDKTSRK